MKRGFTILELLLTVLIFSAIFLATFTALSMGRRSWRIGIAQIEVQQDARKVMDAMLRELRAASAIDPSTFIDGVSDDIINFTVNAETVSYAVVAEQLVRTAAGTPSVLANNISGVQFNLFGGDVIYVNLTTQSTTVLGQPVQAILNSQVLLRN